MNQDYEKIIDFYSRNRSLPDDFATSFRDWMIAHEGDKELTEAMYGKWVESLDAADGNVDARALTRLIADVSSPAGNKRRLFRFPKLWRTAAVVAMIIVSSVLTYKITESTIEGETVLMTSKGSAGEFTLPDGSLVRLNSDTRLSYDPRSFTGNSKRKVSVDGEAFFEVTKDENHPFVVDLQGIEVEVVGTSFDVRNYKGCKNKEVVLLTGRVDVKSKDSKDDIRLEPNQRFVCNQKTGNIVVEDVSAINYCRWIQPRLKLESEPLSDLLITVSRKYGVDLEISPTVDLNQRVSLTMHNDDFEDLMTVIAYLTDIKYQISENILYVNN